MQLAPCRRFFHRLDGRHGFRYCKLLVDRARNEFFRNFSNSHE